jgi:hypothetical protein
MCGDGSFSGIKLMIYRTFDIVSVLGLGGAEDDFKKA